MEPLLQTLVAQVRDIVAVLTANGTVYYCNASLTRVLGYEPSEVRGLSAFGFIHEDDIDGVVREFHQLLAGDEPTPPKMFRVRHKDGSWRIIEASATLLPGPDDVPLVAVIGRDLTEHVRTQELLEIIRERSDYLRRLADRAPDILFRYELAPVPRFSFVSEAATRIVGYTPREHYSNPDLGRQIIHPDDVHVIDAIEELALSSAERPLRVRWRSKDGRTVWTELRLVPVYGGEGLVVAIEGIARDITDRVHLESQLWQVTQQLVGSDRPSNAGDDAEQWHAPSGATGVEAPVDPGAVVGTKVPAVPAMAAVGAGARRDAVRAEPSLLHRLSEQEHRLLPLLASGMTNRQIAQTLHLSEHTVKTYVSHVLRKLGLQRRAQIAALLTRAERGEEGDRGEQGDRAR